MSRGIDWKEWAGGQLEAARSSADANFTPAVDDPLTQMPMSLIFQDEDTLACARPICGRLLKQFGDDSFRVNMWPLAALGESGVFARVFADAADSDIVMFALRGDEPLPALIQNWVQAWQERRVEGRGAVVAVFLGGENDSQGAIAADQELHALMQSAGLDYFSQIVRQSTAPPPNESAGAERIRKVAPVMAGTTSFHTSVSNHWGINE